MITRVFFLIIFGFITAASQTYSGNYSKYKIEDGSVIVSAETSSIRLFLYSADIVRLDFLPSSRSTIDSSLVVVQAPATNVKYSLRESDSSIEIQTSHLRVRFQKYPLRISFFDSAGKILFSEPLSGGLSYRQQTRSLRFLMDAKDHFYGTGERGTSLDKRKQRFVSYNTQIGGYSEPLATMNLNVPFVATTNGYALYIDNTYRGIFDFGSTDSSIFSYTAEGGELSFYILAAPTVREQLEKYTWLTGRQPLPPRWMFGYTQSKNRYANEEEARSIVATMREKEFPCDAIVLDLAWFKYMGDISWDLSSWPNHEKMVTDFLSKGIKTILITEPYIIQPSKNFTVAEKNGFLAKDSTGKTQLLEKWWSCNGCNSSLLDLTDPKAQEWWWSKHPSAFGQHVAGIWTDLGEPEKHPESMVHYLGSAIKIHNIYNLLWAKTVFDGFNQLRPNERVVNLTRSGFAGIQRYGVLPWSGDVARSFGGLSVQLPMLLNMGMSGIAYHNSDIGGYARNPTTPELYIRWMQYGVFCPITRAHGAGENVKGFPTEPWQFGKDAERINRDYIRLRYKLLPYIYTLAYQNYRMGIPLARPLFWLDASDPRLVNESSSYMWGDAFLVSPVVTAGQTTKEIYLPKGQWTNYWTDENVDGGRTVAVSAPLEQMPIFVKAGSIIPTAPVMNYSDEHPLDTLTIQIYPDPAGKNESSFTMYEDDGKTLDYQSGNYALTKYSQIVGKSRNDETLRLRSSSQGTYHGMLKQQTIIYEIHNVLRQPLEIKNNKTQCKREMTWAAFKGNDNSYYYDRRLQRLYIQTVSRRESANEIEIPHIMLKQFRK